LAAILYWVIRRMLARGMILSSAGTAPQPGKRSRLAVIDSFEVDGRRRLVLLRRDNVEHLVMIGGRNDLLIEATIRRVAAQPQRGTAPGQALPQSPVSAQAPAAQELSAPLPQRAALPLQPASPVQPAARVQPTAPAPRAPATREEAEEPAK